MKNNNTKIPNSNHIREEQQEMTVCEVLEVITVICMILLLFSGAFSNETEAIAKDEATTEVTTEMTTKVTTEMTTEVITEPTTEALKVAHATSWLNLLATEAEGCFYITADGEKIYSNTYIFASSKDALRQPIYIWSEDSKELEIHFSSEKYGSKEVVVKETGFYDYASGTVFIEFMN